MNQRCQLAVHHKRVDKFNRHRFVINEFNNVVQKMIQAVIHVLPARTFTRNRLNVFFYIIENLRDLPLLSVLREPAFHHHL